MLRRAGAALAARARAAHADDRGEVPANTVAAAALLALFFLVVQIGLFSAGHQTARGAARHALDIARLETGTAEEGEASAEDFLRKTNVLQDPVVDVTRTADTVTVTVRGTALSPTPLIDPTVTVTMSAPVERVVE